MARSRARSRARSPKSQGTKGAPIPPSTNYLLDDKGNILTDDKGNRLTWK